jgi:hypothetical protein
VQQLFPSCSVFSRIERGIGEELLRYEAMTGLNDGQLTDLVARIHGSCGDKFISAGRPLALGLFRSVALVCA